ncbi:MAG: hypothetical protein JWN02_2037, partial [Acidobacteria bacterium]|nr:hypothetical protein [Acidobacteriota bacterium]
MRGVRSSLATLLILLLAGCGSTVPCEVLNSFDRVRPARGSKRVCNEQEAGTTHVVVLSVAPWSEYVGALQPSFA